MNVKALIALAVAVCSGASPASAQATLKGYYVGEFWRNSRGGLETGSAYLTDAAVSVAAKLDDSKGGTNASFFAQFMWNNGARFSERFVGDLQSVSNIDAGRAARVYELWYEHPLADDATVRVGLYDLNTEFDAMETAGLFINGSHGIGAEYGLSGENGPSIFPVTSLAARFDWRWNTASTLRYALLDGVPGDRSDPSRAAVDLGGGDGVLHALEYVHRLDGGTRLGIGGWLYSAAFRRIDRAGASEDKGNGGIYGFAEGPVYKARGGGIEVRAFLRYGVADDAFNAVSAYLGAGAVVAGLVASRPDDRLGFAIASARTGKPFRRERALAGMSTDRHDTSFEITYSARINDWLRLQPDVQYIVNPGANPALANSLVFGLRVELAVSREWP